MMRGKPDLTKLKDPTDFLEGGKAEEKRSPSPASVADQPKAKKPADSVQAVPKRQKLVELPEPIFNALKDRAYEDFKKTGRRVTETEIIVAALTKYLNL